MQSQLQDHPFPEIGLKEKEKLQIRGALLGVVKTIATANKLLDSAPIEASEEQRSLGLSSIAPVISIGRNVYVDYMSRRTPSETLMT